MGSKFNGYFSPGLLSLQIQLKTLFEGVGGDKTIELLDSLSNLNKSEQNILLEMFKKATDKVLNGPHRLTSPNDDELKAFEDGLYNDLVNSFQEAANHAPLAKRLEVVDGGKEKRSAKKSPARLTRKLSLAKSSNSKQLIN